MISVDEAAHLRELLAACHRALEQLDSSTNNEISEAIRETCRLVASRLAELSDTKEQIDGG